MTVLYVLCGLISLVALVVAATPFFFGEGGRLMEAAAVQSPEKLRAMQGQLVEQFLRDESLFEQGALTLKEWELRKGVLMSRYIDVTRRLEYLSAEGLSLSSEKEGES